jgi:hypothetical protein
MRFSVPLEINGIVEAGLTLSGGATAHHPDRHVTFELAVAGLGGLRRTRLIRADWRDIKGGHTNNRRQCAGTGKRVPETHLHSFELNWRGAASFLVQSQSNKTFNLLKLLGSMSENALKSLT